MAIVGFEHKYFIFLLRPDGIIQVILEPHPLPLSKVEKIAVLQKKPKSKNIGLVELSGGVFGAKAIHEIIGIELGLLRHFHDASAINQLNQLALDSFQQGMKYQKSQSRNNRAKGRHKSAKKRKI